MGGRSNYVFFKLQGFSCLLVLMVLLQIHKCCSLNLEGLALLEFRASVDSDPNGAFTNWSPNDYDPCMWSGVHCVDGKVQMLVLEGLSLVGILSPELGKLTYLRSLVLYKNHFSGFIPKEIGGLTMLELLDLRGNSLSGTIPAELGQMSSLKRLLLCDNKFQGSLPSELERLNMLSEIQFDDELTFAVTTGIHCLNRKLGHCIWQNSSKQLKKAGSFRIQLKGELLRYLDVLPLFNFKKGSLHDNGENCCANLPSSADPSIEQNVEHILNFVRRRLLQESTNLPAAPASDGTIPEPLTTIPSTRSSGAFPAIPNGKNKQISSPSPLHSPVNPNSESISTPSSLGKPIDQHPSADGSSGRKWKYVIVVPIVAFVLIVASVMLLMCRSRGVTTIGPWKTGLSGQLQKAFVTGVPKLNRPELETACEDFSNIIETLSDCTVYKGTLSSGVEIAVVSIRISSSKDWTESLEAGFRRKIDTLSRVNHKNFVNLLGYCEEDEPFLRMMVFEYAPNGTLFEHLHVKEVEFLDWNARTRIIMGTAYCLQYMHHELNPPVAHPNLQSSTVYLTDDYAAKIAELNLLSDFAVKREVSGKDDSEHSLLPPLVVPETNVYSFGILLLEIISAKVPYSKDGTLQNWVEEYMNDKQSANDIIDPLLKSVKNNELNIICEVIKECIQEDPRQRPTMREITSKLREVIPISPDSATPRLSPLWWAELEILSVEAT
ncbi:Protein kinase domain [Macleaya cordata]|uniref:Protein kinase domain n=1 Tax=Macleaya cordata TaxID=56857 RepID=A0A200Q9Y5_MACCD|nr:Protein kinase domain [Macleaya cordata]